MEGIIFREIIPWQISKQHSGYKPKDFFFVIY